MEHNIDVMEGTRFPLCVTLKDGEGNALAADGFRVYGGAVCPGMGAVAFPVTRSGGDFVVMVPGLAVGRMPWRYQVFVVEQATGVEWLLCSGEVRPEARCADASGGVAAVSLTVTGVLDKQTLSLGVQLGESTELCRSLVARAEEAARRAEEAAAGASFTLTVEDVQKVVPMKWEGDMAPCFVAGYRSLALGSGAEAKGVRGLALGSAAKVSGDGGLAVGDSAQVSYMQGTAVGCQASASASGSTAVGCMAKASGQKAAALGDNAEAKGSRSVAVGVGATAGGGSSVVVGDCAYSVGYASITVGSGSWTGGSYNVTIGRDARTLNEKAVAVGAQTKADGDCAVALGGDARVEGHSGLAVGGRSAATGACSVAVGANALAKHESAFVLGIGAVSKNDGEMVLKATNVEEGTSVSLSFMAGTATGGHEDMWGPMRFVEDTRVKLTVRDELSGLQHSVAVSLNLLMYHLKAELQAVSEFGVVEGDGYGYGY